MSAFTNLPAKMDGADMPRWSGIVNEIPTLLKERTALAAANWYVGAPGTLGNTLGDRPVVRQFKKDLKAIGQQLIADETVAQAEFVEAVEQEYRRRLLLAQGDPQINEWARPRRIAQVQRNFAGSQIAGMP